MLFGPGVARRPRPQPAAALAAGGRGSAEPEPGDYILAYIFLTMRRRPAGP
jgi:hypothetical protein